jgi:hypothetical protein
MAEIITQYLNVVNREFILVNEDGVVCWTGGSLQARMRKEEEIVELGMDNICIDDGARWTVSGAIRLATISGEEADVVTFSNDDECDLRSVSFLEGFAGGADCLDLRLNDVGELTF